MKLKTLTKTALVLGMLAMVATAQAQVPVTKSGTGTGTINSSLDISFNFTGTAGTVGNVSLDLAMTAPGNYNGVSATLKSPGGVTQTAVFGSNPNTSGSVSLTFNSTGSANWGTGNNENSGTFTPVDAFSAFNGTTISGVWTLTVAAGGAPTKSVDSASLTLTPVPEPATYATAFGMMAMGVAAYRRMKKA